MSEALISCVEDLAPLRMRQGLVRVVIDTRRFTYRNLLPHALKYGLWALAPGGTLLVRDASPDRFDLQPRFVSFKLIRQWVFKLLAYDADPVRIDTVAGEIELRRTRLPTPPGWSAGVVFSGAAQEVPQLHACLDALLAQPELHPDRGGEIVVSGPAAAAGCVAGHPAVSYHTFEMPPGPRILIGRKKNDLIRVLHGPRILILHTRIQLEPDTLRLVPTEFEIATPRILAGGDRVRDYLSLGAHDSGLPGQVPRLAPSNLRRVPAERYLALFDRGPPYIDGGCFMVRKDIHARCPLHDHVAWDEAEDLEWSARALAEGILLDLVPARAHSAVSKLRQYGMPEGLMRPAQAARAAWQAILYRGRDHALRLLGRR